MRIAIAGYGVEGEANYRYWSNSPENDVTIFDQKQPKRQIPVGVKAIIGDNVFENIYGYDLVVRTPSLSPNKIKTDGKIWSATNEFFEKCPATIIGVTGSKGKGTTASYINSILSTAGKKTWLVGNIGQASLDILDKIGSDDFVIYELSSFQLWDLEKSPKVAVVLFIEQEHLDVHSDMGEYVMAKANITKYQSENDLLVFNKDNQFCRQIASMSLAHKIGYQDDFSAHVNNNSLYYNEQLICSVDAMQIEGKYNYDNICAAIDAIWLFIQDSSVIERGIREFKGLRHRLQFVDEINGVKYYDNSIATTPSAAISAIRSFDQRKIVILGGSYKGSDFNELVDVLISTNSYAIMVGKEGNRIADICKQKGFENYQVLGNVSMDEMVNTASNIAKEGDVVLLSPAAASFDMFENYSDRGDQFQIAVRNLESSK